MPALLNLKCYSRSETEVCRPMEPWLGMFTVAGCWNGEVVSTVRGEECHLRLLLMTGDTMKSSTYVGQ
ncbi:hypothetical protein M513_07712 [Trichuris suis]|uniref:Uncharacterized protein n=1 Tax=Trichuris suis TaxID=68888 RepID=A0A085M261_9BILA|nr:hypothetical protein M513_07712 [Trichuris suis]